jgi:hypothetical protein
LGLREQSTLFTTVPIVDTACFIPSAFPALLSCDAANCCKNVEFTTIFVTDAQDTIEAFELRLSYTCTEQGTR